MSILSIIIQMSNIENKTDLAEVAFLWMGECGIFYTPPHENDNLIVDDGRGGAGVGE
jgi:hypothetical protein